jgi:hypothetical protein
MFVLDVPVILRLRLFYPKHGLFHLITKGRHWWSEQPDTLETSDMMNYGDHEKHYGPRQTKPVERDKEYD